MKKVISIILMIIGLIFFAMTYIVAIFSQKLPEWIATYGFIILGYLSLIAFALGVFNFKVKRK
jgi:hypothetical protein